MDEPRTCCVDGCPTPASHVVGIGYGPNVLDVPLCDWHRRMKLRGDVSDLFDITAV